MPNICLLYTSNRHPARYQPRRQRNISRDDQITAFRVLDQVVISRIQRLFHRHRSNQGRRSAEKLTISHERDRNTQPA